MMKFIFPNATHTVSIYNRNTLTHIEYLYHFTWRHSLDLTSFRYSLADKLLVKFSCRLLHVMSLKPTEKDTRMNTYFKKL